MLKLLGDGISDERRLQLSVIGAGLSQLAAGQPVNLLASPAGQMLQRRQRQQALDSSGVLDRFTPEQRAILAQMPPTVATKVIAGEVFRRPDPPSKGVVVNDRLVNPVSGQQIADYSDPPSVEPNVAMVGPNYPSRATHGLPDDGKTYEVKYNPETMQVLDYSLPGGQGTIVNVDLGNEAMTPGREAVDKVFADTYVKWVTGGGADAANQAAQIKSVLADLEAGEPLTGKAVGLVPDFMRALVNPAAKDAQERVEGVVQRSLREILGAQFAEREGERLISRAFNPSLPPEYNAARLRALYTQLEAAAQAKQAMVDYFADNGTLIGYAGPQLPSIDAFEAAIDAVPAPEASQQLSDEDLFKAYGLD